MTEPGGPGPFAGLPPADPPQGDAVYDRLAGPTRRGRNKARRQTRKARSRRASGAIRQGLGFAKKNPLIAVSGVLVYSGGRDALEAFQAKRARNQAARAEVDELMATEYELARQQGRPYSEYDRLIQERQYQSRAAAKHAATGGEEELRDRGRYKLVGGAAAGLYGAYRLYNRSTTPEQRTQHRQAAQTAARHPGTTVRTAARNYAQKRWGPPPTNPQPRPAAPAQ
jgi:hypothetical protein